MKTVHTRQPAAPPSAPTSVPNPSLPELNWGIPQGFPHAKTLPGGAEKGKEK